MIGTKPRKLRVWMESQVPVGKDEGPVMYPDSVLYTEPNPDRSRKSCQNCLFWVASDQQCYIHDADVVAPPNAICGYHIYGQPAPGGLEWHRTNMVPVHPQTSGLMQVAGGVSCDTCRFYMPSGQLVGACMALREWDDEAEHPVVEALGCCARWENRE